MADRVPVIVRFDIAGNRIAERIKALGLTVDQAAHVVGISSRQLYRSIHGPHPPRLKTALQIASGLNSTVEYLFPIRVHKIPIAVSQLRGGASA